MVNRNWSHDSMTVEICVTISKDKQTGMSPGEVLTYRQEFEIPAKGFTEVAAILGRFDTAVGAIEKYKPRPGD